MKSLLIPMLAALDHAPSVTASGTRTSGVLIGDLAIVILSALGVAAALFLWAKYLRKPSSKDADTRGWQSSSRRQVDKSSSRSTSEEGASDRAEAGVQRRRRKRMRRDHRARNPTLAETGGLPPQKTPTTVPPHS